MRACSTGAVVLVAVTALIAVAVPVNVAGQLVAGAITEIATLMSQVAVHIPATIQDRVSSMKKFVNEYPIHAPERNRAPRRQHIGFTPRASFNLQVVTLHMKIHW